MKLIWTDGDYGSSAKLPESHKFHDHVTLGYTQWADKKWTAEINFKRALKIGKFDDREQAKLACEQAADEYFGTKEFQLPDGGTLTVLESFNGVVVIVKDTKGELHVAFSTDGDGFPSVDISGPEGTPVAVEEYDTVSQTTVPITPNEFGSCFHKPVGPIHVTLYETD